MRRVSVIIPTYNHAPLLKEAIGSLLAQKMNDWDAIIIDNHSDDETVGVVEAFGDTRLRLEKIHNHGVIATSRNKGISLAKTEWIAFLDSDDLWKPDKLTRSMAVIGEKIDLISHREEVVQDGKILSTSPHHSLKDAKYRQLLFKGTCFSPSAALIRKSMLDKIGGFSEDPELVTAEDYDLWLRLINAGANVEFVNEILSSYRLHDKNSSSSIDQHMNSGLKVVEAHYNGLSPKRPLDGLRLKARRSMIIYGAGRSSHRLSLKTKARSYYLYSLINYPFNSRALVGYLLSALPYVGREKPKPMVDNPFLKTTEKATADAVDGQGRNRWWWETKPMTYVDWTKSDRLPRSDQDFIDIKAHVQRTGPWLKAWFERIDLSGLTCADIGSGSGIFSYMLARRGAAVISMDLTETSVMLTSRTTDFFKTPTLIVRGDVESAPFATNSLDFVYSWGVLHHTNNMQAALLEVSRILKPGGQGLIMVYHKNSVVYYLHGLFWLIIRGKLLAGYNLESVQAFYTDGFYHRYLTKSELKKKLVASGLTVKKLHVTQYEKKILPCIPARLDQFLKGRFGMCLIAEFRK